MADLGDDTLRAQLVRITSRLVAVGDAGLDPDAPTTYLQRDGAGSCRDASRRPAGRCRRADVVQLQIACADLPHHGPNPQQAEQAAAAIMKDRDTALDTGARGKLGWIPMSWVFRRAT